MVPAPFTVAAKRRDTADTWTLDARAARRRRPRRSRPGSSRCSRPAGPARCRSRSAATRRRAATLVHTVRAVGLATAGDLRRRARARCSRVRGPFGRAWPRRRRSRAPTSSSSPAASGSRRCGRRSLHLLAHRERYGRLALLYGGRAPDQLLYEPELAVVAGARPGGGGHGRQRRARVARPRRRRHAARRPREPIDGARTVALRLRPRGDDALRRGRAARSAASRRRGSTPRWSATCSAASATAATASSGRR